MMFVDDGVVVAKKFYGDLERSALVANKEGWDIFEKGE